MRGGGEGRVIRGRGKWTEEGRAKGKWRGMGGEG